MRLAGMIFMQSAAPGDDFEAKLQVTAGGDDALAGGIAVGGPIGENGAGYRLSAHHFREQRLSGTIPFLGRDDTNGRNETSARARFDWTPRETTGRSASSACTATSMTATTRLPSTTASRCAPTGPGRDAQESMGASLYIEWDGSRNVRITSVSSIAQSDIDFSFDADWGNDRGLGPRALRLHLAELTGSATTINREVRFMSTENSRLFNDSADWLVGLYINQLEEGLVTGQPG